MRQLVVHTHSDMWLTGKTEQYQANSPVLIWRLVPETDLQPLFRGPQNIAGAPGAKGFAVARKLYFMLRLLFKQT